jgi:hypothetical protein
MFNCIKYFDFFSKNVTLYTRSSSKVYTCLGFILTIISVMLFGLIFYFESYEVFKREHPNAVLYRQNINRNNSTLSINNNIFNFYINLDFNFPKEMLYNHLRISAEYRLNGHSYTEEVSFEECNDKDKIIFEKLLKRNVSLEAYGINLCPRMNFEKLENNNNFNKFDFTFEIRECDGKNKSCIPDYDFYHRLNHGNSSYIVAQLYYIDSRMDLTDYDNPYWVEFEHFIALSGHRKLNKIKLEGSEISTQSLFSFNKFEKKSQFSVLSSDISDNKFHWVTPFISYQISFNSRDMYIYNRTYKTLNSAFANSFALFKLITWVFSIILSPYYTYYKNTYIINNNFEQSVQAGNKVNNINISNDITIGITSPSKPTKLTTCKVIKNVSLMRYLLCRKSNRIRSFYNQAQILIGYSLSIENLFRHIVDYSKLKDTLLSSKTICELDTLGQKLVLNDDLNFKKKFLQLELLIVNKENIAN